MPAISAALPRFCATISVVIDVTSSSQACLLPFNASLIFSRNWQWFRISKPGSCPFPLVYGVS